MELVSSYVPKKKHYAQGAVSRSTEAPATSLTQSPAFCATLGLWVLLPHLVFTPALVQMSVGSDPLIQLETCTS